MSKKAKRKRPPDEVPTLIALPAMAGEPVVPSFLRLCDTCGQPVWVSKRAESYIATKPLRFLCMPCAFAIAPPEAIALAPWVRGDVEAMTKDEP